MKFSIFTLLSYLLSFSVLMIGSLDTVGAIGFQLRNSGVLENPVSRLSHLFLLFLGA